MSLCDTSGERSFEKSLMSISQAKCGLGGIVKTIDEREDSLRLAVRCRSKANILSSLPNSHVSSKAEFLSDVEQHASRVGLLISTPTLNLATHKLCPERQAFGKINRYHDSGMYPDTTA